MTKIPLKPLMEDYHLLSYDVLDSTNDEAKRLAAGGGAHGAVIWSKKQTAGRGRMGRHWISSEGNFFVSALLAPNVRLEQCAQLSFVMAVAVAETLEAILPDPSALSLKWPNDILVSGKKIGGILLESVTTQEMSGTPRQWVIAGVGINIDSAPEHVLYPATCLRTEGVELISAKIVLSRFLHHFLLRYDDWAANGFAPAKAAWEERAYQIGKPIAVMVGDERHAGIYQGIDASGQLLLKTNAGNVMAILAGDVLFEEKG